MFVHITFKLLYVREARREFQNLALREEAIRVEGILSFQKLQACGTLFLLIVFLLYHSLLKTKALL